MVKITDRPDMTSAVYRGRKTLIQSIKQTNTTWEAPIAQLGERRTLDRKVAGSILTRGAMLCT